MLRVTSSEIRRALVTVAILCAAGCGTSSGPIRGAVSGEVTLDGAPIDDGVITFIPTGATQGAPAGTSIAAGRYSLDAGQGPTVGTHRVEIVANRKTGKKLPAIAPATGEVEEVEQYLPARYNTQSELKAEIKVGTNTAPFPLTSK